MIFENGKTIHLVGKSISYVMCINEYGDLTHYHFGSRIPDCDYSARIPWYAHMLYYAPEGEVGLENTMQEYPAFGHVDLRTPAYTVVNSDKNAISRLRYKAHRIYNGKYAVDGMPALFAGDSSVQTAEITLSDDVAGFDVVLYYSVYDEYDIITRSVKFVNTGKAEISINRALSANLDLPEGNYDAIYFDGVCYRERQLERTPVSLGSTIEISNARGGSGHHMNPFVMVCSRDAGETYGEVYGFSLVYSGDHATFVSNDIYGFPRIQCGINPHNFEWTLKESGTFMTPECVMCYSANGFEQLSHSYHEVYSNNLCKSEWAKKPRPIVINNWEGTHFDFNEEKILAMAERAKYVGCELFVLDDGWFGKRNDDKSSLGDWYVNREKLPDGISGLADKINAIGLDFGLWFEPEMISPDSDLYREHPDWAIHVPNRPASLGRNQYMLDLTREDVCDYVIESVKSVLSSANIKYVKWDMNRYMTDCPSLGYSHKHVLGFYKVMDAVCTAFPDVLFEGCAAGGGRFDPGVLAYMPQIWTSDNTDPTSRVRIQYSTSFVYPLKSISSHVASSPNNNSKRSVSLEFRGGVAMTGAFGYEFDITKLSNEETEKLKRFTEEYKSLRSVFDNCKFYRLQNPYDGEYGSWETVSADGSTVILFNSKRLFEFMTIPERVKLRGLDCNAVYENTRTGEKRYGAELMNIGIDPEYTENEFTGMTTVFKKIY